MSSIRHSSIQIAALPVRKRKNGRVEVLLITSRKKGTWLIPRGWPCRGMKDKKAAAKEAHEEAGVRGTIRSGIIGVYRRRKRGRDKPIEVQVYLLNVTDEKKRWPEHRERRRKWTTSKDAARTVSNPDLKRLLHGLRIAT
jgi:8-oxo-dGTP pyrophosphatase MutT (NUDIX family)